MDDPWVGCLTAWIIATRAARCSRLPLLACTRKWPRAPTACTCATA